MTKTILITGASSGIGAACIEQASIHHYNIIATARNAKTMDLLKLKYPKIKVIVSDIASEFGRSEIIHAIDQPIDFLLHNAATLDLPQAFSDMKLENFKRNISTNTEPVIFLTLGLLKQLKLSEEKSRILSISSGAAKTAIAGLGNYCISKAAALMANQVLKLELSKHNILVNDYFPGVVDTKMQKTLRSSNTQIFPFSDEFKNLKKNNKLSNPLEVASHIMHIFNNTDDNEFCQSSWQFPQ